MLDSEVAAEVARLTAVELEASRVELTEARTGEAAMNRRLDENDAQLTAAGDRLQRVETDRRDASTEIEALQGHLAELTDRVAREAQRIAELEASIIAERRRRWILHHQRRAADRSRDDAREVVQGLRAIADALQNVGGGRAAGVPADGEAGGEARDVSALLLSGPCHPIHP